MHLLLFPVKECSVLLNDYSITIWKEEGICVTFGGEWLSVSIWEGGTRFYTKKKREKCWMFCVVCYHLKTKWGRNGTTHRMLETDFIIYWWLLLLVSRLYIKIIFLLNELDWWFFVVVVVGLVHRRDDGLWLVRVPLKNLCVDRFRFYHHFNFYVTLDCCLVFLAFGISITEICWWCF